MAELTAPLVMKNDDKRIVYGPVLVPNEPDSDNDTVTEEQIETLAHKFVEDYGNIDLQHSLNNVGKMIESYILPVELELDSETVVPKGSWMLGVRVTNDDTWQAVKDQKLGGFSIMAIEKTVNKSQQSAAEKNEAQKRTTLADLEDGWIVNAVSLVDEPAVPKAKWTVVKSKSGDQSSTKAGKNEEITQEMVQKAIDGSLEHRERVVRRKVYATFDTETTESYVHSTLDDSVIIKIENMLENETHIFQIGYAIDETGNVSFTGQPQPVRIEENVVPVNTTSPATLSTTENEVTQSHKSEDGFMAKIMKKLGFASTEKAGRSISEDNLEKLRVAKGVINDLLAEEESNSNKSAESGEDDMKEQEVQNLIEKSMQPVNDKLAELTNTLKGNSENNNGDNDNSSEKGKGDDTSSNGEENAESGSNSSEKGKGENGDNEDDNESVSKSDYEKVLDELEKAKKHRPFSKKLAGQDNMDEKEQEETHEQDRNAFGFKSK